MKVTSGVGTLTAETVDDYLKHKRSGVLTVVDKDQPYCVPMEHYYDGQSIIMVTSSKIGGRKLEALRANPNASYVVYDSVSDTPEILSKGVRCRSVMIEGKAQLITKEIVTKRSGPVLMQVIKLSIDKISNWQCTRTEGCDWNQPWYDTYPELIAP